MEPKVVWSKTCHHEGLESRTIRAIYRPLPQDVRFEVEGGNDSMNRMRWNLIEHNHAPKEFCTAAAVAFQDVTRLEEEVLKLASKISDLEEAMSSDTSEDPDNEGIPHPDNVPPAPASKDDIPF